MAGERNVVEAVVRAKYEAQGSFDNFGRDLKTTTQSLRIFGGAIASEINPVLGQMLFAMTQASRETKNFGLSMATIGVGSAAAAVAIGSLISGFNDASRRAVEFRQAVDSLNFSGVKSQIDAAAKSLDVFDQSFFGLILGATRSPGAFNVLDKIFGRESLERFLQDAREGFARVLPLEQIRIGNTEYAKQLQTVIQLRQLEAERYASFNQLEDFAVTQQKIEQSLVNQFGAQEKLIRLEAVRREAEAHARPGGALPGEIALSRQQLDAELATNAGQYGLAIETGRERARRVRLDIAERQGLTAAERSGPDVAYPPGYGTPEFNRTERSLANQTDLMRDQQRLQILQSIYGLTQAETAQLQLQTIEANKRLKIEQADEDQSKIGLANLEAQVRTANVLRQELERTNGLAGLAAGFRDLADEAESTGNTMRRFAQDTARGMNQAFSDLFFNVITGNFKNLADFGKQFGLAFARNFSDALAQSASAPILRGLAGLTGNFFPDTGMSLLNIAPGGTQLVNSLQRAGYSIGGDNIYTSAPAARYGASSIYPSLYQTPSGATAGAPGGGFGIGPGEGEGAFMASSGYAGLGIGVGALGLSILASRYTGMTAGAFAAGAAGLSIGASIGGFAASAAGMSGAAAAGFGAGVASLAAVTAMVAYLAIADATSPKNPVPRTPQRIAALVGLLGEDARRVQAAGTFLELAAAIQGAMHQAFGGPSSTYPTGAYAASGYRGATKYPGQGIPQGRGASEATAGFAISIAGRDVILPGGSYPATMTLDEFAALLETSADTFTARLQLGIAAQALQQINQNFEQVVKDQARLIATLGASQVAYEEFGPGLRRTTVMPLSATGQLEPGRYALSLDRRALRAAGIPDSQIDALTKAQLARNSQTDRIPDWSRELQFLL